MSGMKAYTVKITRTAIMNVYQTANITRQGREASSAQELFSLSSICLALLFASGL